MSILVHDIPFHRFGIEIECFGPEVGDMREYLRDIGLLGQGWDVDFDASVDKNFADKLTRENIKNGQDEPAVAGLEIKSPPLAGQKGLDQLKGACAALRGLNAEYNVTTGLHMHFDAAGMSFEDIKRVVKAFLVYEDGLEFFISIPESRVYNASPYAKSLQQIFAEEDVHAGTHEQIEFQGDAVRIFDEVGYQLNLAELRYLSMIFGMDSNPQKSGAIRRGIAAIDACETLEELVELLGNDRNMKFNIMALEEHGTLEYRQPGAIDVNFEKLHAVLMQFDFFLAAALDDALPMDEWVWDEDVNRKQSFLLSLYCCTPSPEMGYLGLPWRPGMEKFARRFWPDFHYQGSVARPGISSMPA